MSDHEIDEAAMNQVLYGVVLSGQQEPEDGKRDWSDFNELDVKNAIRRINNNEELYIDVLKVYAQTQNDFADVFYAALDSGDMGLAERKVHSLRGTSATIGSNEIYELANNVEMALRNQQDPGSIKKLVVPLERLQKALCEKIIMKFEA